MKVLTVSLIALSPSLSIELESLRMKKSKLTRKQVVKLRTKLERGLLDELVLRKPTFWLAPSYLLALFLSYKGRRPPRRTRAFPGDVERIARREQACPITSRSPPGQACPNTRPPAPPVTLVLVASADANPTGARRRHFHPYTASAKPPSLPPPPSQVPLAHG